MAEQIVMCLRCRFRILDGQRNHVLGRGPESSVESGTLEWEHDRTCPAVDILKATHKGQHAAMARSLQVILPFSNFGDTTSDIPI